MSLLFLLSAFVCLGVCAACVPLHEASEASIDIGSFTTSTDYVTVLFKHTFDTVPVVVTMPSLFGPDPVLTRIRGVTQTSFEVALAEPLPGDGEHATQTLAYVAMEPGTVNIGGMTFHAGSVVSAAQFAAVSLGFFDTIPFGTTFGAAPALLAHLQTTNSETAAPAPPNATNPFVTTAVRSVTTTDFELSLERGQTLASNEPVVPETVGFIAITGTEDNVDACRMCNVDSGAAPVLQSFVVGGITGINNGFSSVFRPFPMAFAAPPVPLVVGTMNTRVGFDGGWVRGTPVPSGAGVRLAIDEDQAVDAERNHFGAETVGLLAAQFAATTNVAPSVVATFSAAAEGSASTVSLTITDPARQGDFTVSVAWGDGTPNTDTVVTPVLDANGQQAQITLPHVYVQNSEPGVPYEVLVTVTDVCGASTAASLQLVVPNVVPTLEFNELGCGTPTIEQCGGTRKRAEPCLINLEGAEVFLNATLIEPGQVDDVTVTINWGDGAINELNLVGADELALISHQYADSSVPGSPYLVTVTVEDEFGSTEYCTALDVVNVPPVITNALPAAVAGLEGTPIMVFDVTTDEPGDDVVSIEVTWGDGSPPEAVADDSFDGAHTYADNGVYTATLRASDDDGASSSVSTEVTIGNVAPQIDGVSLEQLSPLGDAKLTVQFSDASSADTFELTINWGDGSAPQTLPISALGNAASKIVAVNHRFVPPPGSNGQFVPVIDVTLRDDDGGEAQQTHTGVMVDVTAFAGLLRVSIERGGGGRLVVRVKNLNTEPFDVDNVAVLLGLGEVDQALVFETDSDRSQVESTSDTTARWPIGRLRAKQTVQLVIYAEAASETAVVTAEIDTEPLTACQSDQAVCDKDFVAENSTLVAASTI